MATHEDKYNILKYGFEEAQKVTRPIANKTNITKYDLEKAHKELNIILTHTKKLIEQALEQNMYNLPL